MITKITGEQPFQVLTNNFSISPSNEGYTLQISADGENYSNLFTVGAGVTRLVTGVAANSYYRLSGNQSAVSINWMKTCVTEGGGSGSGSTVSVNQILSAGTEIAQISVDGNSTSIYAPSAETVDLSAYYTSAQTEDAISSALTGYTPSTGFSTINGSAITEGGDLVITAETPDLTPYWTSAQTKSYTDGEVGPLSAVVQEQQIVFSSGYNELHTQVMELSGKSEEVDFLKTRVQTNEQVLATAVNDVNDMKVKFSAYTPTSGFSTINGSAITNGGNLVIEGGGDNTKLLSVAELPATAETGTVMAAVQNFGYWCGNTFYLQDYENNTKQQKVNIASCDYNGQNFSLYLVWDNSGYFRTGPVGNIDLDNSNHNSPSMWLPYRETWDATNHTLTVTSPSGLTAETINISATCVFQYDGSGWTSINNIPLATQTTPGLVKGGTNVEIGNDGSINANTSEVERSNYSKMLVPGGEELVGDPWDDGIGGAIVKDFYSLSGIVSFKSSELADYWGEGTDVEIFGATYAPNQEGPHLHLYYEKEEEQDPYFTFDDLEETGDIPRFDLVDGTSAFTFTVDGDDGSNYTYTATVTVENADDVKVVITIYNNSDDKDAEVDIWSDGADAGSPIYLKGNERELAKTKRIPNPEDPADFVVGYAKYYNEDNIQEVVGDCVKSNSISNMWKGTQAEYDTLTQSGATADPNTFYIIVPTV